MVLPPVAVAAPEDFLVEAFVPWTERESMAMFSEEGVLGDILCAAVAERLVRCLFLRCVERGSE